MPDTSRLPDRPQHSHPDLPPPGKAPLDAVDRFADALDALILGTPPPDMNDANERSLAHLTATAGEIQQRDGVCATANGPRPAISIGQARKQRIWEDLMAQHAPETIPASTQTRQPAPIGRLRALLQPWVAIDDGPARKRKTLSGPLRFVPDLQPATTFALVIAVLIAVGAGFAGIVEPGGPTVTPTASARELAGNSGGATPGSPAAAPEGGAAIPTADSTDEFQRPIPFGEGACSIEPRSVEEIAAILRDPGPVTPRAYLPATPPDPAIAAEVARAGRTYLACQVGALETPRFIYADPANTYFREGGSGSDLATREEQERLAALVLGEDYQRSRVIVTDLAMSQPHSMTATPPTSAVNQSDVTFLPELMIQLADGRIAGPEINLVHPDDVGLFPERNDTDPVFVTFFIFARDATRGDQWSLDERLPVCLGGDVCDEFYANDELLRGPLFPDLATPSATPAASPAPTSAVLPSGSPVAESCPITPLTDQQIADIRDSGSRLPAREYAPVSTPDAIRVAEMEEAVRISIACAEATSSNSNIAFAMITDRAMVENPLGPSDRQTVIRSREISGQYGEALVGSAPSRSQLDTLMDQYNANDMGFMNDLGIMGMTEGAPQVFRVLPDGRIIAYPAELWLRRTGMLPDLATAPNREAFLASTWTFQRGRWLLDEQLVLCLGDCAPFWAQAEVILDGRDPSGVATPSATPAASPAARTENDDTASVLKPVMAEECTLTPRSADEVAASGSDPSPPPRSYGVSSVPTAGNADRAVSTYREWTACLAFDQPDPATGAESLRFVQEHENLDTPSASDRDDHAATVDTRQHLAESVLSGEPRDYLAETSAVQTLLQNGDYAESGVPTAMLPEQMVRLDDGRIGGPVTVLLPIGTLAAPAPIDQMEVPFIIFASDPSHDDSWLVDEWLMLCVGDCDAYWATQAPATTVTTRSSLLSRPRRPRRRRRRRTAKQNGGSPTPPPRPARPTPRIHRAPWTVTGSGSRLLPSHCHSAKRVRSTRPPLPRSTSSSGPARLTPS